MPQMFVSFHTFIAILLLCANGPRQASAAQMDVHVSRHHITRLSPNRYPSHSDPYDSLKCQMRNFTQVLDHFNPAEESTFSQRYYVCPAAFPSDKSQAASEGNVILFLGNEGPLDNPSQPIVFENAARMKALVIQVEVRHIISPFLPYNFLPNNSFKRALKPHLIHCLLYTTSCSVLLQHRYYGTSMPFTPDPSTKMLTTEQYQYLTIEQVMADTKSVLETVRREFHVSRHIPTVVIGGSYGGQLAAYHRLTYPETFQAAIAASAPIQYVLDTPMLCDTDEKYHQIIGRALDVMTGSSECSGNIRIGMKMIKAANDSIKRQEVAIKLG